MKTPLIVILTGALLGLLHLFNSRQVDVVFCTIILFSVGLLAWTIEQYHSHRLD